MMKFLTRGLCVVLMVTVVLLASFRTPVLAEPPERTPRFMMTWHETWNPAPPLDWDEEGSAALVIMHQEAEQWDYKMLAAVSEIDQFLNLDYRPRVEAAIMSTLETNLADQIETGEISDVELILIAEMLLDALDGADAYITQEVMLAGQGGVERRQNVYFLETPPQGAAVHAGPNGNVLVLGEFLFHEIYMGESPDNPPGAWIVTDEPSAAQMAAHIAIGWFNK